MSRLAPLLRYLPLLAALGALFAVCCFAHREFLTIANQRDVLGQVAITGILAVGMTLVILTGGIDLSVGSIMSLCTVVCAILLMAREPAEPLARATALVFAALLAAGGGLGWWAGARLRRANRPGLAMLAVGLCLAAPFMLLYLVGFDRARTAAGTALVLVAVPLVGALLGAGNGLVIAHSRLQPFIVTLAMMVSAVGLAKYVAGQGGQIHTLETASADRPGAPPSFAVLKETVLTVGTERLRHGGTHPVKLLPVPGLFLLGVWLLAAFVLHELPLGRYIFAVGGNEEAARLAGVPVRRVKVFVYAASGLLAGLAAVLYTAQYEQGKADAGLGKELDAIAAVVIGGTSLMGGRGSILGTLVGVLIFGYLTNILQLRAVSSEIQDILKGIIIVGAALIQSGAAPLGIGRIRHLWSRRSA